MSKTKKLTIALSVINLIVLGVCFYLFANIKKTDKEVSSRLIQIESEVKREELFRSIKTLMGDTKKEREQIASLFVQPKAEVDFIEAVESLGRTAEVKLEIESVGVETMKGKTSSSTELFRLSAKTEGSWRGIIHLLALLENMPFSISFENLNLGKISGGSNSKDKKQEPSSYWSGNFTFSVLKIKNPSGNGLKVN
ncbi:MAG: seg [Parcubacteria group bacterium]|nr:seg [Parcubacteria group bacterium]